MTLRGDPDGIAPERALVFEVAGSLSDFYAQTHRIPGLEFLMDQEIEFDPDDDFHRTRTVHEEVHRVDAPVGGRLYMAMPDLEALRQIISLWDRFSRGERLEVGFAPWSRLFALLRDLRAWGPQDRVLPETVDYLRARLLNAPDSPVRFEAELWYHQNADRRTSAGDGIRRYLEGFGGAVVSSVSMEDIRYHGMLIDLPPAQVRELIDIGTVGLARVDDIMYLRPQSIAVSPIELDADIELEQDQGEADAGPTDDEPLVALLDGVPIANHVRLLGRLQFDDPDDLQSRSPAAKRNHGTSMASLILHGDLQAGDASLRSPLYVRPVMAYDAASDWETTPSDRLPLDVIYQAVRRIKEAQGGEAAAAPTVAVINLSLGDLNRPFSGSISPWARLIDWLSFRYRVLFLVSTGNTPGWLAIPTYATREALVAADPVERENRILQALDTQKARRTLLSPAEALNCLSVGAWHGDSGTPSPIPVALLDPFPNGGLPNISSALGLGYRRIVKPDIVYDGGKELVRVSIDEGHVWLHAWSDGRSSGQLSATADSNARGRLNLTQRSCGTSNATALVARASAQIYEGLVESGYHIPLSHRAVTLKTLLVHGATWGSSGQRLEDLFGPPGRAWHARRDNVSRYLGYGRPDVGRVLDCTSERATLFAYGDLERDTEDAFEIPLPPSFEGLTLPRRLTLTLTWLSPVNPRHQQYRAATLEVAPGGDDDYSIAVSRIGCQPTHDAIARGTVWHCAYEGEDAIAFVDDGRLKFRVICRAQTGQLDEPVPYAVAISLETAIGSGIPVYAEVRNAIQAPIRAQP